MNRFYFFQVELFQPIWLKTGLSHQRRRMMASETLLRPWRTVMSQKHNKKGDRPVQDQLGVECGCWMARSWKPTSMWVEIIFIVTLIFYVHYMWMEIGPKFASTFNSSNHNVIIDCDRKKTSDDFERLGVSFQWQMPEVYISGGH